MFWAQSAVRGYIWAVSLDNRSISVKVLLRNCPVWAKVWKAFTFPDLILFICVQVHELRGCRLLYWTGNDTWIWWDRWVIPSHVCFFPWFKSALWTTHYKRTVGSFLCCLEYVNFFLFYTQKPSNFVKQCTIVQTLINIRPQNHCISKVSLPVYFRSTCSNFHAYSMPQKDTWNTCKLCV